MLGVDQHALLHHSHADGAPYSAETCPIRMTLKNGQSVRISSEVFWHKDGTSFHVEYVSTPIIEEGGVAGAVVSFRNISKRRAAEAAMRESEARYRTIFHASYDAIFLVDMEDGGRILDVNEEACTMLGYAHGELIRLTIADIHPAEMAKMERFWAGVAEHGKDQTSDSPAWPNAAIAFQPSCPPRPSCSTDALACSSSPTTCAGGCKRKRACANCKPICTMCRASAPWGRWRRVSPTSSTSR